MCKERGGDGRTDEMRFNAGLLTFTLHTHSVARRNLISSPKGSLEAICGGAGVAPVLAYFNTYLHALLCDLSVYIQGAFRIKLFVVRYYRIRSS